MTMAFDFGEALGKIVEGLMKATEAIQVIGEPVQAGDKLIIPAVVARIGFGAGGGAGKSDGNDDEEAQEGRAVREANGVAAEASNSEAGARGRRGGESGAGGGGGGGVALTPVFLIVDEDGERLLTVPGPLQSACTVVDRVKSTLDNVIPRKSADEDEPADDD